MDSTKVQVKPLRGSSDWPLWKHKIVFVLKTRAGANDVVQGRLCAPAPVSFTSASQSEREKYAADLEKYKEANNEAMTVLTNTLEDEVLHKVIRFQHAREFGTYKEKPFSSERRKE